MKKRASFPFSGALAFLFITVGVSWPGVRPSFGSPVVLAQADWKAEYETVCSKTDLAMTLTTDELKGLIARCDQLKSRIEAEEESTRKVYLRRLQMCRDLYKYVLESKNTKP